MQWVSDILQYHPDTHFVFTHYAFWVFFAVVLAGNALLYKKSILRNTFLFLCSLFFYYKAGGYYFGLLILSTIIDFSIGLTIQKSKHKITKKLWLILSLCSNLGLLAYFKYSYFINHVLHQFTNTQFSIHNYYAAFTNLLLNTQLDVSDITLPVGISFFTFQTISYSVDVYRGRIKAVRNIIDFGFYVSFFPQLVAGPIVRAKEFIPQLHRKYILSKKWFWWAVWLILAGLFKKMVLSNYLSINLVDRVFDAPMMYNGIELILGAYAYTLQIYCDFSGYTDIAIGIALILGFRLPTNFNLPYKATSITDFWRRWHISLSTWLRDYLYIPLGGNRKGKFRQSANLLITMLLGGLWHGAGWIFVVWGGLHGLALLMDKILARTMQKVHFKIPKVIGLIITFHFVVITWTLFRSPDMETFNLYWYRIFSTTINQDSIPNLLNSYAFPIFLMLFGFILHWFPSELSKLIKYSFIKLPLLLKLSFVIVMIIIIYQFSLIDIEPFIYFRF